MNIDRNKFRYMSHLIKVYDPDTNTELILFENNTFTVDGSPRVEISSDLVKNQLLWFGGIPEVGSRERYVFAMSLFRYWLKDKEAMQCDEEEDTLP